MYPHPVWFLKEILFGCLNSNIFAKIHPCPLIDILYFFLPRVTGMHRILMHLKKDTLKTKVFQNKPVLTCSHKSKQRVFVIKEEMF